MSESLRNCISSNNQEVYQALRNTSLNTNIIIVQEMHYVLRNNKFGIITP